VPLLLGFRLRDGQALAMRRVLWVGFIDGRPDIEIMGRDHPTLDRYRRLYRTRRDARQFYQDVRKVVITELNRRDC
jgi:hypothetical protein